MSTTKIVLNRQSDLILDNAQITAPVGIVVADIDGLENAITSIDTIVSEQVSTEISNRIAGDNSLAANLSTEVANRIADVDAEESRSIVAETSLQNNIDAEASLRVVGDESLENAMNAADLSLETDLSAEIARAESAETSLNAKVDYVISNTDPAALDSLTEIVTAFQSMDGELDGAITELATNASIATSTEASVRLAADQSLASDLSTEVVDRTAAVSLEEAARISGDASVAANLSTEVYNREVAVSAEESARVAGDASLDSDLSTETLNRENADTSLEGKISTDLSTANSSVENALSAEISNRIADVDAEESRAMSAEASLAADLSAETSQRVEDQIYYDGIIANEIARAESAEASINDAKLDLAGGTMVGDIDMGNYSINNVQYMSVNDSITLGTNFLSNNGGDSVINGGLFINLVIPTDDSSAVNVGYVKDQVFAEESRAMSTEASLATSITNEASIRLAADQSLATAVSAEQSRIDVILDGSTVDLDQFAEIVDFVNGIDLENDNALLSAVTSIGLEIDAEESRAMSAELVLTNNLSTEVSNRTADVDAEESRAMSAEAVLTADLSTEGVNRENADNSLATKISTDISSANASLDAAISSEISRAESAESSLATELSEEVSYLIANTDLTSIDSFAEMSSELSSEISNREATDLSIESFISDEIANLALTDGETIEVNEDNNTIRLKETIAAPASGTRTFASDVEVTGALIVDGANVIDTINNEIDRAASAETSLAYDFANIYFRNAGVAEIADGVITEFTFNNELRAGSQAVYLNGLLQDTGDYTITTTSVTFANAPLIGDKVAVYGMY